jgi:hypothetical protein
MLSMGCATPESRPTPSPAPILGAEAVNENRGQIAVIGDLQLTSTFERLVLLREENHIAQRRLISNLGQERISRLVVVGDLVGSATSSRDWRHFSKLVGGIRAPILPAMGNHDYPWWLGVVCCRKHLVSGIRSRFPDLERHGTHYREAFGSLGLIWLDSEFELEEQARWLTGVLDEWEGSAIKAVVVFVHRSPFTNASGVGMGPHKGVQRHFASRALSRSIVVAMISGHAHGYEHFSERGTHFIVSGGGGGPRRRYENSEYRDLYKGGGCDPADGDTGRRPFNYVLLGQGDRGISVVVRGLCPAWRKVVTLESFEIPYPGLTR